jgi:hypothetical protein
MCVCIDIDKAKQATRFGMVQAGGKAIREEVFYFTELAVGIQSLLMCCPPF